MFPLVFLGKSPFLHENVRYFASVSSILQHWRWHSRILLIFENFFCALINHFASNGINNASHIKSCLEASWYIVSFLEIYHVKLPSICGNSVIEIEWLRKHESIIWCINNSPKMAPINKTVIQTLAKLLWRRKVVFSLLCRKKTLII